jgi:hypothetical protein
MPIYKILRVWVKSRPSYCHHIKDCRVQYMVLRLISRLSLAQCYGLGLGCIDIYRPSVGNKTCSDISECFFSMLCECLRFTEICNKLENLRCGCQLFRVDNKQLRVLSRSAVEVCVVMNSVCASTICLSHCHIGCFLLSHYASDSVFITATISCL